MIPKSETLAIIPCRNEATTIGGLVEKVRALSLPVLVIDDASTDGTSGPAKLAGANVVRLNKSSGKGAALRTGFVYGLENGFRYVITLDGDGQHRSEEVVHFIEEHEKSDAEMIIGNRMQSPEKMPRVRHLTNRLMSWTLSRKLNNSFPDTQCGFRFIKLTREFVSSLKTSHFEIESEMLLNASRMGWNFGFVPISCVYQKSQTSKIRPLIDTFRWLRWYCSARKSFPKSRTVFHTPALPSSSIARNQHV